MANIVFTIPSVLNQSGGEKLGCSIYRVLPGKTAYPHHRHLANEGAIYILSGLGELRLDEKRIEVRFRRLHYFTGWRSMSPIIQ